MNIRIRKITTIIVSLTLNTSIIVIVPKSVRKLWITIAKLLFIASCTVSTSLVKWLIISPCVLLSKYFNGSFCVCLNRSIRISLTTFWEVCTISLLYPSVDNAPHAYITPIPHTAMIRPFILPGTMKLLTTGFIKNVPIIPAPALINTRIAISRNAHL